MDCDPYLDCFDLPDVTVGNPVVNREQMLKWEKDRVLLTGTKPSETGCHIQYIKHRKNITIRTHAHDFFEVIVVLVGNAVHASDGRETPMSAGDVFFLNRGIRHSYKVPAIPFEIVNIMFRPEVVSGAGSAATDAQIAGFYRFEPFFRGDLGNRVSFPVRSFQRIGLQALSLTHWYYASDDARFIRGQIKSAYDALFEEFTRIVPRRFTRSDFLATVIDYVNKNIEKKITLGHLSEIAGFEKTYVSSKFKKDSGENIMQYVSRLRVEKAKELLVGSSMQIIDIAFAVGFGDLSHFNTVFKKATAMSPRAFRRMNISHDGRATVVRI